jgi:hypothetical protein
MAIELRGRVIDKVAIIDDEPEVRRGYGYTVQNADLTPCPQEGPLGTSVEDFLQRFTLAKTADAGLCDFQLSGKTYATFSGAELVARLYREGFPTLLCTRYEKIQIPNIAPYRRWIPSLLKPSELDEESLIKGIDDCLFELEGNFRVTRRPWRTQVHFISREDDHSDMFFAEIPAWEGNEIIKVRLRDLPEPMRSLVTPDFRCYAQVNLGADAFEDLYWCNWEMP